MVVDGMSLVVSVVNDIELEVLSQSRQTSVGEYVMSSPLFIQVEMSRNSTCPLTESLECCVLRVLQSVGLFDPLRDILCRFEYRHFSVDD